jgi:hypothetical protein
MTEAKPIRASHVEPPLNGNVFVARTVAVTGAFEVSVTAAVVEVARLATVAPSSDTVVLVATAIVVLVGVTVMLVANSVVVLVGATAVSVSGNTNPIVVPGAFGSVVLPTATHSRGHRRTCEPRSRSLAHRDEG